MPWPCCATSKKNPGMQLCISLLLYNNKQAVLAVSGSEMAGKRNEFDFFLWTHRILTLQLQVFRTSMTNGFGMIKFNLLKWRSQMETIKIHWSLLNCCAPHLTGDKGFYSRCRRLLAWSHKWLESKWPMFYFHFPKLFQIDVPLLCQLHLIDEFPALGTSPFIKFITKILSGCLCHQQEHWGRLQYSVLIKKMLTWLCPGA